MKISAIVLTRNEEKRLPECLKTISWADEIIVVDNGSTDKTVEIAKIAGAIVYSSDSKSFAKRRELGAKKASGEWLLYVDADERVGPKLRKEVSLAINHKPSTINAYAIPRKNILLGKEMKFGGWSPDYVLRLIKKSALKGYRGDLHEQPIVKGPVEKLKEPLRHTTHESLTEMVDKTNEWSEIEARLLFKAKHPPVKWFHFVSVATKEFFYRMVRKAAFLDGPVGIIEATFQVFNKLVVYSKLWEMQINKK